MRGTSSLLRVPKACGPPEYEYKPYTAEAESSTSTEATTTTTTAAAAAAPMAPPPDAAWGAWSAWGPCGAGGTQRRSRPCLAGARGEPLADSEPCLLLP
ncbi:Protein of unknown function, partial [Gryllus bimaculatus]